MTNQTPSHKEFLDFANKLADTSRLIICEAIKKKPKIEIKYDSSFVTETDKRVELTLREMINSKYPTHGILGEEFKNENTEAEFVWVLDP